MSVTTRRALLALPWVLVARAASAEPTRELAAHPSPDLTALERLRAARSRLRSLQGRFTQTRTLRLFRHDVVSRGRFALLGATHLLWSYDAPESTSYVWTPRTMTMQTRGEPARTTASRPEVARTIAPLRLALAGDLDELARDYALTVGKGEDSAVTLTARARAVSQRPQEVVLALDASMTRPLSVTLRTGERDVVAIRFDEVRVNEPIGVDTFRP